MDARTAVALSAVAYDPDIARALSGTLPTWRIVWIADKPVDDNMAFIARDPGGAYALAIRGTMMQFAAANVANWIEDLDVLSQVSWPDGDQESKLSGGAYKGLTGLQALTDSRGGTPLSMRDYLIGRAHEEALNLTITGHSLGGTLATVYAVWLHDELAAASVNATLSVWTFAAPAAGNTSFAARYDALFGASSYRCVMDFDVVPTFPVPDDMIAMMHTYVASPASDDTLRLTGLSVREWAYGIKGTEWLHGSRYAQTNTPTGSIRVDDAAAPKPPVTTLDAWLQTIASRHSVQNYVQAVAALAPNAPLAP